MLKEIIVICKDGVEFGSRERGFRHWLLSETDSIFTTLVKDNFGRLTTEDMPKSRYDYKEAGKQ